MGNVSKLPLKRGGFFYAWGGFMKILLLMLIAIFVAVNAIVELVRKDLHPETDPMSSYLTGKYGWIVDASYVALAAAIALLPHYIVQPRPFDIVCYIAAVAVVLVVMTKRLYIEASPTQQPEIERAHVICAGIAFICASLALLIHGWHSQFQFFLAAAAPASAALFARFAPGKTAIEEKTYAGLVIIGLAVLVYTG